MPPNGGRFSAALIVTLPLSACCGGGGGDAGGTATAQSYSGSAQSAMATPALAAGLDATALSSPTMAAQFKSGAQTCESVSQPPAQPSGAILVTNYGATHDDETDDTTAIQAAIDAATLHASNASDQVIMLKADGGRVYGFTLTAITEGRKGEAWTSRISVYGPDASGATSRTSLSRTTESFRQT